MGHITRLLKGNWSNVGLLLPESADIFFLREDCGRRKDNWLRHFGDEAVMKPESVNLMTSARHELGSFISNEEDKKYWKSRSHGVG